jgi:hypothetical protein
MSAIVVVAVDTDTIAVPALARTAVGVTAKPIKASNIIRNVDLHFDMNDKNNTHFFPEL